MILNFLFNLVYYAVVLVNLWKFNLTRVEGYLGQLSELIFLKGPVYARFQLLRGTTIAFIFFVQHHLRYFALFCFSPSPHFVALLVKKVS